MTNSQSEKGEKKSVAPVVAAGVGGLVVGLAIGVAVGTLGAGDEAPIKVKNGSLQLHLMHDQQKFKPKDNTGNKKWEIDSGAHGSSEFEVYFAPTPSMAANCAVRKATGPEIRIVMSDDKVFLLKAADDGNGKKKTEITEDAAVSLNLSSDKRLLTYGQDNDALYIASIGVGSEVCTLSQKDTGLSILVVDK